MNSILATDLSYEDSLNFANEVIFDFVKQIVMNNLRGIATPIEETYETKYYEGTDEPTRKYGEPDWDSYEEWMGYEGAWMGDYSSQY